MMQEGKGKDRATILGLTSIGHFINDGNTWLIPGIILPVLSEMGVNYAVIGLLSALYSAISALASPLVPLSIKWLGGHMKAMALGMFLWAFAIGLSSIGFLIHDLPLVYVGVVLAGVGAAYYHPIGSALLSATYGGTAGSALGVNGAFGSLGRTLYPLIGSLLIFAGSVSEAYNLWVLAFITFIVGLSVLLYGVYRFDVHAYGKSTSRSDPSSNSMTLKVSVMLIILLFIITLLRNTAGQGVQTFLGIYINKVLGIKLSVTYGEVLSMILASAIVGQPVLGWLSDKVGRRFMASLSTFAFAVLFIIFIYTGNLIAVFLAMLFVFSNFPLIMAVLGDLFPREQVSWATSIIWNGAVTGGNVLGSLITGLLAQYYEPIYGEVGALEHALLIVLILAFISSALWVVVPKPPKRSRIPLFG
ncbi:MFS transporter [Caldivirga maquilingensis]|uniref:Major facilitator superfamily MFS_1 n=1 Tax=Caldivirga maquilingensis (strain ATCC 700844 / DSM 13496 / JCM 10307 / IC-167) TaxID=397948 RepID=A8M8Q0_CALMQ|nr:MFS transporter [Caldivirga maquilingensis]ABW02119.1 major facilitator superfamily MFS_1 [Caldivirga maquilingensis IC-167]